MKLKKDWDALMSVVEIMFSIGYTVSMLNEKRWEINSNDNQLFNKFEKYGEEIRAKNLDISNLETFYLIMSDFYDWSVDNLKPFKDWLIKEEVNFHNLIKPYCE